MSEAKEKKKKKKMLEGDEEQGVYHDMQARLYIAGPSFLFSLSRHALEHASEARAILLLLRRRRAAFSVCAKPSSQENQQQPTTQQMDKTKKPTKQTNRRS